MSHVYNPPVNIDSVIEAGPIGITASARFKLWIMVFIGILTFAGNLIFGDPGTTWGAFYVNTVWFMGLSLGGVMTIVIMHIVRATWGAPIRRLGEANIAFFPVAWVALFTTYFGREYLFYWGHSPMPGREWWMQPWFVYTRFLILFAVLFGMLTRFVFISLRGDIGLAHDRAKDKSRWSRPIHVHLLRGWRGAEREILPLQRRMSILGPILVLCYAVVVSLFSFEMIMGQDPSWISNLFGAFIFASQVYMGWALLGLMTIFFSKTNRKFSEIVTSNQLWDTGKLMLGFCMIWGYMFWSQFLTQWYGNLPEETQWLILRTREFPWQWLAWVAFACSFIIPFITLQSRDLKKTPLTFGIVCTLVLFGVWMDRYLIIMPQVSPHHIPLGLKDLGIFIGFLGAYLLCIRSFLSKHPFVPISHPLTHGSWDW